MAPGRLFNLPAGSGFSTLRISAYNDMPHHYQVYGLTLASNREIPGLAAERVASTAEQADIRISIGLLPQDIQQLIKRNATQYHVEPGDEKGDPAHLVVNTLPGGRYYEFLYSYGPDFIVDTQDSNVWCIWQESLTLEDVALYLLGPILGFMLRVRGTTCLHASGVLVNGNAFAVTGASGAGKSTMAAAFAAAGYPILTDDVLPLTTINGEIHTQSGYSRLRLFPNSFKNLQELPDELPLLAPGWNKCYLDLAGGDYKLHRPSAPLKVIYVVDWSDPDRTVPEILPMKATEAVSILAANTYRNELLSTAMRKEEFFFLSTVVAKVQVRKLCPVDDIASVPLVRQMLLADFEQLTGHAPTQPATQDESSAVQ
jgi:hypothetical protein